MCNGELFLFSADTIEAANEGIEAWKKVRPEYDYRIVEWDADLPRAGWTL